MNRHLPFYPSLIYCALLIGIVGGFGSGAYMVFALAFEQVPIIGLASVIQVHGHLQTLGWTGLFIIAVCLYKLPRLMSSKPLSRLLFPLLLVTIVGGILVRSTAQIALAGDITNISYRDAISLGILLESLGIALFVYALFGKLVLFKTNPSAIAAAAIKPFLLVSFCGWSAYAVINVWLGVEFLYSSSPVLNYHWNSLATDVFLFLLLLPTCFAFSLSIFPIFLRLRAPAWPVARAALLYLIGTLMYLTAKAIEANTLTGFLAGGGTLLRGAAIVWLVLELDFIRWHAPWFKKFRENYDREHNPPRKKYADYGEFGNFEWLIYGAYLWLIVAVLYELLHLPNPSMQEESIARHFYFLGFVTHLILGVAVRMIPGFLGVSSIASPLLVRLSFVFIFCATVARTAPIAFHLTEETIFRGAYGLSGVMAILAICCLGLNISFTVVQQQLKLSGK